MTSKPNLIDVFYASEDELKEYNQKARELSRKHFGDELIAYYPGRFFPSVSLTGSQCAQNCLYCNKYYLQNMKAVISPNDLLVYALELEKNNGTGMLLSGGYTEESIVPFEPFLDTIEKIKQETKLKINIHPGLINKKQAQKLAKVGVDSVSFDLITDDVVIKEIIQNGKTGKDYKEAYEIMVNAGLNVIPHICLGLYFGTEKGNLKTLEYVLQQEPKLVVFLGFIPTKGTPMSNSKTIHPNFLTKVLTYSRLNKPKIEQSLGCMRVRKYEYERNAILAGINRIAVPKKKTLDFAQTEFKLKIKKEEKCCSI
ncbi:MAG: radical SAM protein [Candidatus Heimdallarchaeota archaeon]